MKFSPLIGGLLLILVGSARVLAQAGPDAALDALHRAGAARDQAAFTALLARDVVFLGLYGATRLQGSAVGDFVAKSFAAGNAWMYRSGQREIQFSGDGTVAWFDEDLEHDQFGRGRGTGVLVRDAGGWKVAQYNLTVPLYNATLATPGAAGAQAASPGAANTEAKEPQKPRCQMISHKTNTRASC